MPKQTLREQTANVGAQKAFVHLEIRPHSSMNQTRYANGKTDIVHLPRQVPRTEIRKV